MEPDSLSVPSDQKPPLPTADSGLPGHHLLQAASPGASGWWHVSSVPAQALRSEPNRPPLAPQDPGRLAALDCFSLRKKSSAAKKNVNSRDKKGLGSQTSLGSNPDSTRGLGRVIPWHWSLRGCQWGLGGGGAEAGTEPPCWDANVGGPSAEHRQCAWSKLRCL